MLTKTALRSPSFLLRVKLAIVEAVRESHAPHRSALGIGHGSVKNAKGRHSLYVVWRRGGRGLECFDRDDNDVTALVLAALNAWHAEQRKPALPVMEVRELSHTEAMREMFHHGQLETVRAFLTWNGRAVLSA